MSFGSMAQTLRGEIPGVALSFARTKLNEALNLTYDVTEWSFQTQYAGWLNPGLVASVGTFSSTPYENTVTGDAAASAAWADIGEEFITTYQFRNPAYSLYNIIGYDDSDPSAIVLTLDRPWMEPTEGPGQTYWIYQAYFPVPVQDFRKFIEIRDTTNNAPVLFNKLSQDDLSVRDAQRLVFGPTVPTYAVPWGVDQRPESATVGFLLYEIWPHNLSYMPYSFSYDRRGPSLVNSTDTVPYPLDEELIEHRARELIYLFKEAQKGENVQRGSGADWKFLAEYSGKKYAEKLKTIRAIDANLHRKFVTHSKRSANSGEPYSTERLGQLNIGR